VTAQNLDYNQMLDKLRTAALGRAAPMVGRLPILWGVEFAAKGQLMPFAPPDVGYPEDQFWPGAIKSVTWKGKRYGVPTNNETMALIWNAGLFQQAGLDPESPPATWDDLVTYSKAIKDKTGKNGYGLVARMNAGNTPFRFMPQVWAYGGGALDEAEAAPLQDDRDQQRRLEGRVAGVVRHVRARSFRARLRANQHADREPGPVHRRPARHDDQPSQRVRGDARSRQQSHRR
jgi:ABC-type glycerol-3-phosphate transport system substrate-binding protein